MSAFVLDASVTAVWLLDDETEPRADVALAHLEDDGTIVPQLWHLEIRNLLLVAERRGRVAGGTVAERLDTLKDLPIRTDVHPDLETMLLLARAHGLSVYDAIYLELASRRQAALATSDSALDRAAVAEGISLIEPS